MTLKIHNFYIACFLSLCNISIYIFFLIFLRLMQRNTTVDLKTYFNIIVKYIITDSSFGINYFCKLIIKLLILIIILLLILLIFKIRKYLDYTLWQVYMYCRLIYTINNNQYSKKFNKFCDNFRKYSFNQFLLFLTTKLHLHTTTKLKKYLTLGPLLIGVVFFTLESYLSNFVLYYMFYYLFVLLLYSLWIKISENFWIYSTDLCTIMMIEYAYGMPKIIYVNLMAEEQYLFKLLAINYNKGTDIVLDTLLSSGLQYIHPIAYYKRFEYVSGAPFGVKEKIYYNANIEKYFEVKDLRKEGENYYVADDPESQKED